LDEDLTKLPGKGVEVLLIEDDLGIDKSIDKGRIVFWRLMGCGGGRCGGSAISPLTAKFCSV
jgi:hypothetical protein